MLPNNTGAIFTLKKNSSDPSELVEFKLINRTQISPNTFVFKFELPEDEYLGINVGEHIDIM